MTCGDVVADTWALLFTIDPDCKFLVEPFPEFTGDTVDGWETGVPEDAALDINGELDDPVEGVGYVVYPLTFDPFDPEVPLVAVAVGLTGSSKTMSIGTATSSGVTAPPEEVEVFLSLLKIIVYSTSVYAPFAATPEVAAAPPVAPPVAPPLAPPVDTAAPVADDPPLPKTPSPNKRPIIKASNAKIPKSGQSQAGHPPFFFGLVLVSTTVLVTVGVFAATLTSPVWTLGASTLCSCRTSSLIGWELKVAIYAGCL